MTVSGQPGGSLWAEYDPGPRYPTLRSNIRVDVAVIGGGMAGSHHDAFRRLAVAASTLRPRPTVELPPPRTLELEQAVPPRVAFFADAEQIPASEAVGRIAAEMASPYPPGVSVIAPGESSAAKPSTICEVAPGQECLSRMPPTRRWRRFG